MDWFKNWLDKIPDLLGTFQENSIDEYAHILKESNVLHV